MRKTRYRRSNSGMPLVRLPSPQNWLMYLLVCGVHDLGSDNADDLSVTHIIRQGRCTLVATIQMYKILALNCLITAYSLSVQYLDGIKFGDYQVTITGMLMSVCFLCISRAKVCRVPSVVTASRSSNVLARRKTFPRTTFGQHLQFLRAIICSDPVRVAHCLSGLHHGPCPPI